MTEIEKQSASVWPLPKFYFQVKWDDAEFMFMEVSGLSAETQPIEYRSGSSKVFSTMKMPGIKKFSNVTLKKGVLKGDKNLWDKFRTNTIKRSSMVINLLDESQSVTMSWKLTNAFPVKITGTDMTQDGNEVAIESIEIAHEGLAFL